MKKNIKKAQKAQGLIEGLAAFVFIAACFALAAIVPSCKLPSETDPTQSGILDDTFAPDRNNPSSSQLSPVALEGISLPAEAASGIQLSRLYTATGYFPEDGRDSEIENVLVAAFTNTTGQTLEYMTVTLTVNGKDYDFELTTLPPLKSIYVCNEKAIKAPEKVFSLELEVGYQVFFRSEPSLHEDTLSFTCQTGTIAVTNTSDKNITGDIVVYYKSKADGGYFGGITYRFRIMGGLKAGATYNAYAPHAYSHMTEIMFVTYDE